MPNPAHSPPANWRQVIDGVYRSGCPDEKSFDFLETLKLKTVITLVEEKSPKFREFLQAKGIVHHVHIMAGTKEGVNSDIMSNIMKVILDPSNYPLLVHCNQGKHRTGCVIGTLRKMNFWDTAQIVEEYSSIATPKIRPCDVKYLTELDITCLGK